MLHALLTATLAASLFSAELPPPLMPLMGGLDSGPHAVGFRTTTIADPSRPSGPRGTGVGVPRDARARRLVLHVWYPAAPDSGSGMSMDDYIRAAEAGQPSVAAEQRQLFPRAFGFPLTDDEWTRYRAIEFAARRDATPLVGQFPLLAGVFRPVSVVAMSEYLASHGYVVAFVQSPRDDFAADGLTLEALQMGQVVRDLEVCIGALRNEPNVHATALGAIGLSAPGLAPLVLAMRHPDVDAISQLETSYFAPIGTSSYQEVTAYDTAVLRAPMFFAYSESLGRNTDMQLAEIDRMRYAPRFLLYLGEPRLNHWDFGTEGIALADALARRADARPGVLRAFQAMQRYQLAFFDAFVKKDPAAKPRLMEPPPAAGGALIELRERPAVVPAMSRREFRELLTSNPAKAMQAAREGLARDPLGAVFEEAWLNQVGYDLLLAGQRERAVDVFRLNVDAHKGSANALDSFSEALEAAGQTKEALAAAEKAVAALPSDRSIPAAQRPALEAGLRARIARLQGKDPACVQ